MKATDIMHPEDAKAIQMIKSVPGYEKLVRLFMKLGYEMQYRGKTLPIWYGLPHIAIHKYMDCSRKS